HRLSREVRTRDVPALARGVRTQDERTLHGADEDEDVALLRDGLAIRGHVRDFSSRRNGRPSGDARRTVARDASRCTRRDTRPRAAHAGGQSWRHGPCAARRSIARGGVRRTTKPRASRGFDTEPTGREVVARWLHWGRATNRSPQSTERGDRHEALVASRRRRP